MEARRSTWARRSLEGLALGDAFGQRFFLPNSEWYVEHRELPAPPWPWTDDTAMALAVVAVLERHGDIAQDDLAAEFARRWAAEPERGYGAGAQSLLRAVHGGAAWRDAARNLFAGMGSFGNGGAMRAAPLGAYFFDDDAAVAEQARLSAEVTHGHPEGQSGAIAVALAAAWTVRRTLAGNAEPAWNLFDAVLKHTPAGEVRSGLAKAAALGAEFSVRSAARLLGNGSKVSAQDTVPFALWCAARQLDDFEEALWNTVSAMGDRDTTCAIVGGIVALSVGFDGLPKQWLAWREALPDR